MFSEMRFDGEVCRVIYAHIITLHLVSLHDAIRLLRFYTLVIRIKLHNFTPSCIAWLTGRRAIETWYSALSEKRFARDFHNSLRNSSRAAPCPTSIVTLILKWESYRCKFLALLYLLERFYDFDDALRAVFIKMLPYFSGLSISWYWKISWWDYRKQLRLYVLSFILLTMRCLPPWPTSLAFSLSIIIIHSLHCKWGAYFSVFRLYQGDKFHEYDLISLRDLLWKAFFRLGLIFIYF